MRVRIIALGTRGDVQPCVALAIGLRAAGHDVRMALDPAFEPLARPHGLETATVHADTRAFFQTDLARKFLEKKAPGMSLFRMLGRQIGPTVRRRFTDCWEACQDAEVVVATPIGVAAGYSIAEKLRRPLVRVVFAPAGPFGPAGAGARLNRWAFHLFVHVAWNVFRPATNQARRDVLGLPPLPAIRPTAELDRQGWPTLCAYSPHVCPPPPDAGRDVHVTGYWFLDDAGDWQPPPALAAFLAAGPPPVYVGFGSMTQRTPEETTALVSAALARAGQRGVLATGWGALTQDASAHVHVVDDAPHDWLFPRVAAVVHHGGAGTTAAGLRAGCPTVVVPFGIPDQPVWGRRIYELGVGPRPIPRKHLTVARLSEAIRQVVSDESLRGRAEELGAHIRREDGVARAVGILQSQLRGRDVASPQATEGAAAAAEGQPLAKA